MTGKSLCGRVAILGLLGVVACESQSSTLLFDEPRVRACIVSETDPAVAYAGWPLQDQHNLQVIGQIDVDGEWRSVELSLDIPSRKEALSTSTPLPVCRRKEDPPCDDVEEAYVIASYREYLTDDSDSPKLAFDSAADGATVAGNLKVVAAEQDFDATPVAATFDITFEAGGKTRHLVNGGVGIYTSPPDDTGDCPDTE